MKTQNNKLKRLNSAISLIDGIYHYAACLFGISDSILTILYTLSCLDGECMLCDIYKSCGIPKQTINSAVRRLENDGLIILEQYNGKSKKAKLTEKGIAFADKTVSKLIAAENNILDSWSEGDSDLYISLNQRYAEDLKKQLKLISEVKE